MTKTIKKIMAWMLYPFFQRIVGSPGKVYQGARPALGREELRYKLILEKHIRALSVDIGERSLKSPEKLEQAADYIWNSFAQLGYEVREQEFAVDGKILRNLEAIVPGTQKPEKILVLGAHYDTVPGTPGADDNASGIAALLALAETFKSHELPLTLRFVAFSNEETYNYETMGSYAYAKRCRENNDEIVGMISLEMLGSFSQEEGSQNYPFPFSLFYPSTGDFIAFVGNSLSRDFLWRTVKAFRGLASFPAYGCAAPDWVSDASRSDHLSFWKFGYPALMVTDTSNFRYEHYHKLDDTIDKLDLDAMSLVVAGLSQTIKALARS